MGDEIETLLKKAIDKISSMEKKTSALEEEISTLRKQIEPEEEVAEPVVDSELKKVVGYIEKQEAEKEEKKRKIKERYRVKTPTEVENEATEIFQKMLLDAVDEEGK